MNERFKKQLDFIMEIDKMKNVFRRTVITGTLRQENDAEHSWHLALIAMVFYEYAYSPEVNLLRVIKMLLIHDIVEVYAGDTFAFDEARYRDKEEREREAADKIFGMLPDDQNKEYRELWEEFDAMQTPDSIYAAAADRFEPFMLNCHTQGHTWVLGSVTSDKVYKRLEQVKMGMPALWETIVSLIEENIEKGYIKRS